MIKVTTFQEAFIETIRRCTIFPDHIVESRNGKMYEVFGMRYEVLDPSSFRFDNKKIGRIQYDYAEKFYDWMVNHTSSDVAFKDYPPTKKYLDKPKHSDLPENFNTFYGPRIKSQLPFIIQELKTNKNSRRAVISILQPKDLMLLDKDETLEFPCADSVTFNIRKGKLYCHLHMRSQNMAHVAKLDMYLWGRFHTSLAKELNVRLGSLISTIVSAHVFDDDIEQD